MKVTIDGMTFEGSEDEIDRVVTKYGNQPRAEISATPLRVEELMI